MLNLETQKQFEQQNRVPETEKFQKNRPCEF